MDNPAGSGGVGGVAGNAGTGGINENSAGAGGTAGAAGMPGLPSDSCDVVLSGAPIDLGVVAPLYAPEDAKNPPIVTTLPDGTIITRGAGRVRNRPENEATFATYDPVYYEDRSYGFIVEDFTPTGAEHIRVTYLPIAEPDQTPNLMTNLRAWKEPTENVLYQVNAFMTNVAESPLPPTGPVARVQQYDLQGAPQGRTMAVGQNLEFEFGIFLDPTALTTPGSRTSYHTDTFRYAIGVGGLTPNNLDHPDAAGPVPSARLGGDTTLAWLLEEPDLYFDQMALNIQQENAQSFLEGRRLFHTNFTTGAHQPAGSPAFTAQSGKGGPLMNAGACETCHSDNGPGEPQSGALNENSSMVFKLYDAGELGDQLRPEQGVVSIMQPQTKTVTLGDGSIITLSKPSFVLTATTGDASHYSARLAPLLVGEGLLEAIDEQTILASADRLDCNHDGISGRPNYVKDEASGTLRIGRLGWKADAISVKQQVASDAWLALGVENSLFPKNSSVELEDSDLQKLITFVSLLGVPPQRDHAALDVSRGETLFQQIGCASCHLTEVTTGADHPLAELRNQSIKPFTDLLLHDMGADLADDSGVPEGDQPDSPPSASEWRTPALWGIGLRVTTNGHTGLLHDARAASVLEAALWHGGEATQVTERLMALPGTDRDALIAYVMSL